MAETGPDPPANPNPDPTPTRDAVLDARDTDAFACEASFGLFWALVAFAAATASAAAAATPPGLTPPGRTPPR